MSSCEVLHLQVNSKQQSHQWHQIKNGAVARQSLHYCHEIAAMSKSDVLATWLREICWNSGGSPAPKLLVGPRYSWHRKSCRKLSTSKNPSLPSVKECNTRRKTWGQRPGSRRHRWVNFWKAGGMKVESTHLYQNLISIVSLQPLLLWCWFWQSWRQKSDVMVSVQMYIDCKAFGDMSFLSPDTTISSIHPPIAWSLLTTHIETNT